MSIKTKKNNKRNSLILKCDKYLSINKEEIIIDSITNLYNKIDKICKNIDINFSKNVNLDKVITGTLDKLRNKKGTLQFLTNALFSPVQYFNVSGFDIIKQKNNKEYPIKSTTLDKIKWNKAQFHLQKIITDYNNKHIKNSLIMMCEQYKINENPSESNSNQNEFETLYNNKLIDTSKNFIKGEEVIYHTYTNIKIRDEKIRIVNIHSSSALKQDYLANKIQTFVKDFPRNTNKYIIFGGDSNIYYNRGETPSEKNWCNDGISNINLLIDKLFEIGYITMISRNIVYKKRPYNFFNNSQSVIKYGDEPVETMFIAIPLILYKKYRKMNKFNYDILNYILAIDDNNNVVHITKNNFIKNKLNAFQGSENIKNNGKLHTNYNNIFNSKIGGNLISDHVPIYLDLDNTRIIYSNNVSLLGKRGINNTMNNRQIWGKNLTLKLSEQSDKNVNKNIQKLQSLSNILVKEILKNNTSMLSKLNINTDKFHSIKGDKEKLRYLTNLQICII